MINHALEKHSESPVAVPRSLWQRYRTAKPGWHIVIPLGLGAFAAVCLTWAWTVLEQNEYAVALLLVLLFLVTGAVAAFASLRRITTGIVLSVVVLASLFSGLKVLHEKGQKSWTALGNAPITQPKPTVPASSPEAKAPEVASRENTEKPKATASVTPTPAASSIPTPAVQQIEHFRSHYAPIANVPDQVISFFPSTRGLATKVTFRARIGHSQSDGARRLVIDLPDVDYEAVEAAKYAMEHKQEILDRIIAEIKKAEPQFLEVPIDHSHVIIQHRKPFSLHMRMLILRKAGGNAFIEGPELPPQ